jgi:hypothetical protein
MCLNETYEYNKVRIGKNLSDAFPIQNSQKQGDALSPIIFIFTLDYVFSKFQNNEEGLELSGTHTLLIYADDDYKLGESTNTTNKDTSSQ